VLDVGSRVKRAAAQAGLADEPFDWQMEDRRAWQWPVVWYDDPAMSVFLSVVAIPHTKGLWLVIGAHTPDSERSFYGRSEHFRAVTDIQEDWLALELQMLYQMLLEQYGQHA
jgi:hypothetical protein